MTLSPSRNTANVLIATAIVLGLATANPASAQNVSPPLGPPVIPPSTVTSFPPLGAVGQGGCAQQYTAAIQSLSQQNITADDVGLAANAVGAAADVTGLVAQEIASAAETAAFTAMSVGLGVTVGYGVAPAPTAAGIPGSVAAAAAAGTIAATSGVETVALAAQIVGATSTVVGVGSQIAAQVFAQSKQNLEEYVSTLPNCEAEFTGTVTVSGGGVNVTGDSIFHDDVAVDADMYVSGEVQANQVHAAQGISAHGGNIWLGDTNGTTYSSGITIGGGAISGAGSGGAPAFTGDVDAIAIGNGASAMTAGSVALGLDSSANGEQDVVIGAFNNTGLGGNNTVVGNEIDIIGDGSSDNTVLGVGHQVTGSGNFVAGDPNTVVGSLNVATGVGSSVTGDSNVAIGDTVTIVGNRAIAVGNGATASADDTTVIGTGASATATGSAAFGHGATATLTEQQVFGTTENTYTAPGITSHLSRRRQTGALDVATSDAGGNLATDGGQIYRVLSQNRAGIAVAMAIEGPDLRAEERFGIAVNWGVFENSHGLGIAAVGVISDDVLGTGTRLAVQSGFGASVRQETYGGRTASPVIGGRAGFQASW